MGLTGPPELIEELLFVNEKQDGDPPDPPLVVETHVGAIPLDIQSLDTPPENPTWASTCNFTQCYNNMY